MGTIIPRKRKDGSVGYTAQIRLKRAGKLIHTESQTFDKESAAKAWLKKREVALLEPGALDKVDDLPLSEVITKYLGDKLKSHGKTKEQVLRTIQQSWLGELKCSEIKSQQIVEYLKEMVTQPQTRGNYLSHLSSVIAVAKPAWGYPLDKQVAADARAVASTLGLISKSKTRTRRPSLEELDAIMEFYSRYENQKNNIPMRALILFSIFSTRRQEETCRITVEDLDLKHSEIIVRDMKNPGEKQGNDVLTSLTPEALQLISNRQVESGRIWPYNAASVSSNFTRAMKIIGIDDLHFHDLRHEGISRLFEMGWEIPKVARVSGHRSWQSLQRYTQFKKDGDKYAGWKWKEILLKPVNP